MSETRLVVVALIVLSGCAPRVEVVDAVSGAPIAAQVERLDGGRLLVEASGYETWSGPTQARVELHPLWLGRFAGEAVGPHRAPLSPCGGCPGVRSR